jgi:hypothetical protein
LNISKNEYEISKFYYALKPGLACSFEGNNPKEEQAKQYKAGYLQLARPASYPRSSHTLSSQTSIKLKLK